MSAHQLAIAKASFSAGLLRPDPISLPREEIAHFHALLNSALIQCTAGNVQKCKQWILENIIQSTGRFTALGKYLAALTTSLADDGARLDATSKREPSIKRKRLHLLYLVNDLLYHAKYQAGDVSICGKLQPVLVALFGNAASFTSCPKHLHKIEDLLSLWEEKEYYSREYVNKLRETVKNASEAGSYVEGGPADGNQGALAKVPKSTPYVMPATHGDPSTPWYDLPAGNIMPHIVPNSTRPINPDMIKPLQFVAGPADEALVVAVKALLDDVQTIFDEGEAGEDDKLAWDIDELGQPIVLDEITGDVIEGEGYYGWSRAFCEKMKRRRKGPPGGDGTSRSRSSSRGRKRRRDSDDGSSPMDRASRPRRAYSSSRSPSPEARQGPRDGDYRSRSRNKAYSRSPPRQQSSPPKASAPFAPPASYHHGFNAQFPPPPPMAPFAGPGLQPQYGSWPVPPPFPPAWPPPPPPGPNFHQPGGFPPPPGWQAQMQYGDGRGSSGWHGGRGGYRGRGGS